MPMDAEYRAACADIMKLIEQADQDATAEAARCAARLLVARGPERSQHADELTEMHGRQHALRELAQAVELLRDRAEEA